MFGMCSVQISAKTLLPTQRHQPPGFTCELTAGFTHPPAEWLFSRHEVFLSEIQVALVTGRGNILRELWITQSLQHSRRYVLLVFRQRNCTIIAGILYEWILPQASTLFCNFTVTTDFFITSSDSYRNLRVDSLFISYSHSIITASLSWLYHCPTLTSSHWMAD
jgi:hypothetical protein